VTTYSILYWQEIPSLVEAKDGETTSKAQLSDRFQDLIDKAAMRRDLFGTDAYIEGFKKGPAIETEGNPEEAVRVVKEGLENNFEEIAKTALHTPET
jgi:hypothetical protein